MTEDDILIEKLAELEHEQWMRFSKVLANTENLSKQRLSRWKKLWETPYKKLDEDMKDADRIWARRALKIFKEHEKII